MNEKIKESLKSLEYNKDLFSKEYKEKYFGGDVASACYANGIYVGDDTFLTFYEYHEHNYNNDEDQLYVIGLGKYVEKFNDIKFYPKLFKNPEEAAAFLFAREYLRKLKRTQVNEYGDEKQKELVQLKRKVFDDFSNHRHLIVNRNWNFLAPQYLEKEPDFNPLQIMSEEEFLAIVKEKEQEFSRLKERESKRKLKEERKEERREKSLFTKLKTFVKEYKDKQIEKGLAKEKAEQAKKEAKEEYDNL